MKAQTPRWRALDKRVRVVQGKRPGRTTDEPEWIETLKRENRELHQANETLRERNPAQGFGVFRPGEARQPIPEMTPFIGGH